MTAKDVGEKICSLVRDQKWEEALSGYYADDVVSVEAAAPEGSDTPRRAEGIEAIRGKNAWWEENHEVHGIEVEGPFPHGDDRFAAVYAMDVTFKPANQRFTMKEVAVYRVEDGKIVEERFFYDM